MENTNIETFVISEGNVAQRELWTVYGKCLVCLSAVPLPQSSICTYIDQQIKILSVTYWEVHLIKYKRDRQLNTAYSVTVLQ